MKKARWYIGILLFLAVMINYFDRVNISHAILVMSKELGLSGIEKGLILSAFSWGYVVFMLPGGWLVDKYGPKIMNLLACFTWSIFTFVTGLAFNFQSLLVSRFFLGMGESPIFPGNARIVSTIFPLQERGKATALFDVGSYVGSAIAAPICIFIMLTFGWRTTFFISSAFGFLWCVVWIFSFRNQRIKLLQIDGQDFKSKKLKEDGRNKGHFSDFLVFFSSSKIWGMCIGFFCYNYLKSFFLTWFPSYLVEEKGFALLQVGFIGIIPLLSAVGAELLAGYLTDKLIERGVSVTIARKLPICVGLALSSVVVLAAYSKSIILVVFLLSLSYASLISASTGIWAIPGDIAPSIEKVGTIGGIQNTFSNIAGIVAPIITGFLYDSTGSFTLPLLVSGVFTLLGAASYWFIVGELRPLKLTSALIS